MRTAAGIAVLGLATVALASPQIARPTILGVGASGKLDVLGSVAVAAGSHCVATDDAGHAYVCDPGTGALLVVSDPFPAVKK
jgi:hypothetical protein